MELDTAFGDPEPARDLLVGEILEEPVEDLPLPVRQIGGGARDSVAAAITPDDESMFQVAPGGPGFRPPA